MLWRERGRREVDERAKNSRPSHCERFEASLFTVCDKGESWVMMSSKSKSGYEAVPDVEESRVIPTPKANPRETYPEADELQARLLGDLDEVIRLPNPKVELPRIQAQQVAGAPTTWSELWEALKIPTQTFIATVLAAILTVILGNSLVQEAFPYVACVCAFASSVPSLSQRFTKQSDRGFETLDEIDGTIDAQVDAVTFQVQLIVDSIQDLVKQVVAPVRPKIVQARKLESVLKKYDDSIDIPDPDDIERELDGCNDAVQRSMDAVKRSIDFRKCVPVYFRSRENFKMYMVYPVLAIFLALQIYGVYQSSQLQSTSDTNATVETTRFLRGFSVEQELDTVVEEVRTSTMGDTSDENLSWYPIWSSIQVYVSAIAEILLGFVMSQAAMVALSLNIAIGRVENQANEAIDTTGAAEVFNAYLTSKMEAVRAKLLKLVENMIKVDKVQEKLSSGAPRLEVEHLKDSAKETLKEVKGQQGFPFKLIWSPSGKK